MDTLKVRMLSFGSSLGPGHLSWCGATFSIVNQADTFWQKQRIGRLFKLHNPPRLEDGSSIPEHEAYLFQPAFDRDLDIDLVELCSSSRQALTSALTDRLSVPG